MSKEKEMHIWIKMTDTVPLDLCHYHVTKCLYYGSRVIHTTLTHFCSCRMLDEGYRLFVHMPNDKVIELKYGKVECTDREIRQGHNLEKLLLNGEFGEIDYKLIV